MVPCFCHVTTRRASTISPPRPQFSAPRSAAGDRSNWHRNRLRVEAHMKQVLRGFFAPPLALARVGGADTPLDAFTWVTGRTIGTANRIIIKPAVTFRVDDDGR